MFPTENLRSFQSKFSSKVKPPVLASEPERAGNASISELVMARKLTKELKMLRFDFSFRVFQKIPTVSIRKRCYSFNFFSKNLD